VVTCIVYVLYRRYPKSWIRFVNVPIFFNAAGNIPPAVSFDLPAFRIPRLILSAEHDAIQPLVHRRLLLQLPHPEEGVRVVEEIQLPHSGGTRYRRSTSNNHYLLCAQLQRDQASVGRKHHRK
jgi:hypothetical protein